MALSLYKSQAFAHTSMSVWRNPMCPHTNDGGLAYVHAPLDTGMLRPPRSILISLQMINTQLFPENEPRNRNKFSDKIRGFGCFFLWNEIQSVQIQFRALHVKVLSDDATKSACQSDKMSPFVSWPSSPLLLASFDFSTFIKCKSNMNPLPALTIFVSIGTIRYSLYLFFISSYVINWIAPWLTPNIPGMKPYFETKYGLSICLCRAESNHFSVVWMLRTR